MTGILRGVVGELRRDGVRVSLRRVVRATRRYGLRGATQRATVAAGRDYRWHCLSLGDQAAIALPVGLVVTEPGAVGIDSYAVLSPMNAGVADDFLEAGGRLFLVRSEEATAFACWIFTPTTPVGATASGWMSLPANVVCLEHSLTAPSFRGQGIAPAAWSAIADSLTCEEFQTLVTKVSDDNVPTLRALTKVGFRYLDDDSPVGRHFAAQLGRRRTLPGDSAGNP